MANFDRPRGFQPYGSLLRSSLYQAGSTVYPGDFVRLASDGQVDAAAAGETLIGVALQYATVGQDVMVSDDPDQRYVAQADEAELDAQTDVGQSVDIVATAGNSTYKTSRQEIDSSTAGTSSGQLLILALNTRPDLTGGANMEAICKINELQFVASFAGV
jgi:hypothetical protein